MFGEPTIGIIGGSGWLGRSLAQSMLETAFVQPRALILSSRSTGELALHARWPQVRMTRSNQELLEQCQVIIVAVRPEQFPAVSFDGMQRLVISLMAGVSMASLVRHTGCSQVIRAMPNAAAEIGKSYTPWLATASVTPEQKAFTQCLFETCGGADEVFTEADLNYLSALVGTGPAYPALLAQAMFEHALAQGLPKAIARRAVDAVVMDASQLLDTYRPEQLLDALRSYRGVTAAGLEGMSSAGFVRSVNAGLDAAVGAAAAMQASAADDPTE